MLSDMTNRFVIFGRAATQTARCVFSLVRLCHKLDMLVVVCRCRFVLGFVKRFVFSGVCFYIVFVVCVWLAWDYTA